MVHRAGVGEPYIVQLVHFNGHGGPSVQPVSRSDKIFYLSTPCPPNALCADSETANYNLPETSQSSTHVYFLDGDTRVKSLAADGTVTTIKNIDAPPNSQVVFAVSPDDRRLAVAIITLATVIHPAHSFTEKLYVEDLTTAANRVELYASSTQAEWPVGWHGGDLIVATGDAELGSYEDPYGAAGFVVLDPATGQVISTLDCSAGLLVPAGSACVTGGCPTTVTCTDEALYRAAWDGTKTRLATPAGPAQRIFTASDYTQLSPDGGRVAASVVIEATSGDTETAVIQDGSITFTSLVGSPQGWLDNDHLVISNADSVFIVDLRSHVFVPMLNLESIPQQGVPRLAGIMPEALG
jgi:hypothetical protein